MSGYAFKFISGKYQGGEFPIPVAGDVLIGRASDLDLVLVEDMVSRKHAKLTIEADAMHIADLGSTNGTFVNGEKIKRAELRENDRVLIGTSILKVIPTTEMTLDEAKLQDRQAIRDMMEELGNRARSGTTMSGDLQEVPLPDLLQLFGTNRKSGVLRIRGSTSGDIFIKQGQLMFARIDGHDFPPLKALGRMLTWESGNFQLDDYDESMTFRETLSGTTESILLDELRYIDETRQIEKKLPDRSSRIALCDPLVPRLSALTAPELDMLQHALNFGDIQSIIDEADEPDYVAIRALTDLLSRGYIEAG
ncbi:MAG: FHA domain-containing protein [Myxococcota bacterium]